MIENVSKQEHTLKLIQDIIDNFPSAIFVLDISDSVVFQNFRAKNVMDIKIGLNYKDFMEKNGLEYNKTSTCLEYEIFHLNRWYKIFNIIIKWMDDKDARLIVWSDITEIKNSETHFRKIATTDAMTAIYNRKTGIDFLETYLDVLRNGGSNFTVCYLDLNELKYINDNYGHFEGDAFIQTVVNTIKGAIRQTDIFARMGGDEFIIIFPKCCYKIVNDIMLAIVNKLDKINESLNKNEIKYTFSYGIMEVTPESKLCIENILNSVDAKMYYMKEEYKKSKNSNGNG